MYDIKRINVEGYIDCYVYKSKNESNQIITCEVYRTLDNKFNFAFYITSKKKYGYQEGEITGKDGIKSLLWAKNCLIDFLDFFKRKYSKETVVIYPDNDRLRKIYERALLPLGFKITKDKYKFFYIKYDKYNK